MANNCKPMHIDTAKRELEEMKSELNVSTGEVANFLRFRISEFEHAIRKFEQDKQIKENEDVLEEKEESITG